MLFINAINWPKQPLDSGDILFSPQSVDKCTLTFKKAQQTTTWNTTQGAFAHVISNPLQDEWLLIRDHFGCEPLYYYYDQRCLIVSSNLPDMIKHLPIPLELDTTQVMMLFTHNATYSDDTFYQQIKRVEPGYILHIQPNKPVQKTSFWQLSPDVTELHYATEKHYLDRFTELMHESIQFNTHNTPQLAGELSGGIDSSAILITAHQQQLHYPLFMHVANANSEQIDDKHLAEPLLNYINHQDAHFINAKNFELIKTLQFCAKQFAGGAPYIFFMLANNIHQAVMQHGSKVLLSGAGGDQCVSNHASRQTILPYLIKKRGFKYAWNELVMENQLKNRVNPSLIKQAAVILKYAHPLLFDIITKTENLDKSLFGFFQTNIPKMPFYPSIRHYEWDVLQGPNSHEVRMRVEYSAVIAKAMGFEYRYPLLYPPLVEFCFQLPASYKRRNGLGRYLIRKYLESATPHGTYSKLQKKGGIIPATLCQSLRYLSEGRFDNDFKDLPYINLAKQRTLHETLIEKIQAYMFNNYLA